MVSFPSTLISRIAFIRTNAFIIIIIINFSSSPVQEVPRVSRLPGVFYRYHHVPAG